MTSKKDRPRVDPARVRGRRGVALIVVLWLVIALTLLMYAFLGEMQVEYSIAGSFADEKKAEQLAFSAIAVACATVDNDTQGWHGPNDPWYNSPDQFYEFPFGDGAFSAIHPTYDADGKLRWGLEDEASKINLNYATKEVLMKLPWMTETIADSIIDWRDADSNPGPNGAENGYYQGLNPPYSCKNAPFETLEELLYVRDVTQEVLYGRDLNLNGRIDPREVDSSAQTTDPGLYSLVTVWSSDKNQTLDGKKRINLNIATAAQLQQAGLTQQEIQLLAAHVITDGPFLSVAHLLGNPARGQAAVLTKDRFKALADKFAVVETDPVPGLVNINTAPKQVLMCLPGITEDIALKIIDARSVVGADLSSIGWLTDVVTPAQLQVFANLITCRSYQFRIHAVGRVGAVSWGSSSAAQPSPGRAGVIRRMVAVYDRLAKPAPRLVYWKDMTKLGIPYDPTDPLGPDQVTPQ
jgi:type II secretory pathway component PulK